MATGSSYEYPLNERIRSLLRLEFLFRQLYNTLRVEESESNIRFALQNLFHILELVSRSEIKSELLRELERHASVISRHQQTPGVDETTLAETLGELNQCTQQIRGQDPGALEQIRQQEFLSAVRQRIGIPGGTCQFDLPALHFWLQQPVEVRNADLAAWIGPLQPFQQAITLALRTIRTSALPQPATAADGFFQQTLAANHSYQLLRIVLTAGQTIFPEISGNNQRITIRFLEQPDLQHRPQKVRQDIVFQIACCAI